MIVNIDLSGHVRMSADGSIVIEVPDDATDKEIEGLGEQLSEHVDWENAEGCPEDADDVEYEELVYEETDDDPELRYIRKKGRLVLSERKEDVA